MSEIGLWIVLSVAATLSESSMTCLLALDEQRAELQEQFGLVAVIIQGMTDSLDHIGVQFTGCSALSNLGRNRKSLVNEPP